MNELKKIKNENILFLDIETVPQYPSYEIMPAHFQKLWNVKAKHLREVKEENETTAESYRRAGIYAEFGKIICITAGFLSGKKFRMKTFYDDNEKKLLNDFAILLNGHFHSPSHYLCGHNGKEFDFPYIARRMLVHGIKLPALLDNAGKKPWETRHLDTMELWKFGDFKSFTSLDLLAAVFEIPSPKTDIDGSMMYKVYWEEQNRERIIHYNRQDVLTLAQIFLKIKGDNLIEEKNISIA